MNIVDILKNSLTSKCDESEKLLIQKANENYEELIISLTEVLINKANAVNIRQMSIITLKNLISNNKENKKKWVGINLDRKTEIAKNILNTLFSQEVIILKKSCATSLSSNPYKFIKISYV